ncbi:hypothetical protein AAU57_14755 [Nonlabens sp. YIK11]|uniref:hypothetical protein n=1 Tax=Nonlabens sp. YIK11 TaxID=1453349 RepID=UPI0006DCC48D|nr:hypothetical protein [Nonlabens sp. YIK11]KQC31869.1 hypothetical protein AAU57_14755 [Nonlabens sp. YIK11]
MYYEVENKKISKELKSLSRDYWIIESGKFKYSIEELFGSDKEHNIKILEQLKHVGSYKIEGKCNDCLRNRDWFVSNRDEYYKIVALLASKNGHICPECEVYSLNPFMSLFWPRKL